MKKTTRKLALRQETIRTLDSNLLRRAAGGINNYNTSINHVGCSSVTIANTCFSNGYSNCGQPCDPPK